MTWLWSGRIAGFAAILPQEFAKGVVHSFATTARDITAIGFCRVATWAPYQTENKMDYMMDSAHHLGWFLGNMIGLFAAGVFIKLVASPVLAIVWGLKKVVEK